MRTIQYHNTIDHIFQAASQRHPLFGAVCDPTDPNYAMQPYVIRDGQPASPDPSNAFDFHNRAPMCDVFGARQRQWLKHALRKHPQVFLFKCVWVWVGVGVFSEQVVLGTPWWLKGRLCNGGMQALHLLVQPPQLCALPVLPSANTRTAPPPGSTAYRRVWQRRAWAPRQQQLTDRPTGSVQWG